MWGDRRPRWRTDGGQASVETVALLPVYCAVAVLMAQGAVAGYAAWAAQGAARVAARAQALDQDPDDAVREELPAMLSRAATVRAEEADGDDPAHVRVRLRVPSMIPGVSVGTVDGEAHLPSQVGA